MCPSPGPLPAGVVCPLSGLSPVSIFAPDILATSVSLQIFFASGKSTQDWSVHLSEISRAQWSTQVFVADSECQGLRKTTDLRGGGVCQTGDQSTLPAYFIGGRCILSSLHFGVGLLTEEPLGPLSSVPWWSSVCSLCTLLQEPRGFCFSA